jgi:NADH:ubiquinone oxidoreductase subunit E
LSDIAAVNVHVHWKPIGDISPSLCTHTQCYSRGNYKHSYYKQPEAYD